MKSSARPEAVNAICAHCIYVELASTSEGRVLCHRHTPENRGRLGDHHLELDEGDWCGDGAWLVYNEGGALRLASYADLKFDERLEEDRQDRRAEREAAA